MNATTKRTILIAGGSGLIGTELTMFLIRQGFSIKILTRSTSRVSQQDGLEYIHWNPADRSIDSEGIRDIYAVINLSGQNIIQSRWTKKVKSELRSSRIDSTNFLIQSLMENEVRPKHFIQASAMGYFGDRSDQVLQEGDSAGQGFMADLCQDWESVSQTVKPIAELSILRIGLFLHPKGGFYKTLKTISPLYLATSFGNGRQFVNYTSYHLFNRLVDSILNNKVPTGLYHAVGYEALSLNQLISEIAKHSGGAKIFPNVPAFILKLAMGESSAALLYSTRIESKKLKDLNFYKNLDLSAALNQL